MTPNYHIQPYKLHNFLIIDTSESKTQRSQNLRVHTFQQISSLWSHWMHWQHSTLAAKLKPIAQSDNGFRPKTPELWKLGFQTKQKRKSIYIFFLFVLRKTEVHELLYTLIFKKISKLINSNTYTYSSLFLLLVLVDLFFEVFDAHLVKMCLHIITNWLSISKKLILELLLVTFSLAASSLA